MNSIEIAKAHWSPLPDWVEALAVACLDITQAEAGRKIGRSHAVISQVLRNRYKGNMDGIEERVRGAFQGSIVDCPVIGEMPLQTCRTWRDRAKSPSLHNPTRRLMAKTCPICPHFTGKEIKNDF